METLAGPEVSAGTVVAAAVELFGWYEDWFKKHKIPRDGQPNEMPEGITAQLGQNNTVFRRSHPLFFGHKTSTTDRILGTQEGQSIMVRRTKATPDFPILSLFGFRKQRSQAPEATTETTSADQTIQVELVPTSGSSESQRTWTINPRGEFLVNGQASSDPEELERVVEILEKLTPKSGNSEIS